MGRSLSRIATAAVVSVFAGTALSTLAGQQAPPTPQRPTFRAGALFVRVDAYPARDGRIVKGLTKDDFEILEDGQPQAIESFEFIEFATWTPEALRRDPNSVRESLALAADPRYRVFVLYLDMYHVEVSGSHRVRRPLIEFLNRTLGPNDLFGVLTPRQSPADLTLGQQTQVIEEQLTRYWDWGVGGVTGAPDREDLQLIACFGEDVAKELIRRRHLDKVLSDLEELSVRLGGIREERKDVILFSNGWSGLPPADLSLFARRGLGSGAVPPVGVGPDGRLRTGDPNPGALNMTWCSSELVRLAGIDFSIRYRQMIATARQANVTIHTITPAGLEAPKDGTSAELDAIRGRTESLQTLAENTAGVAVVHTNDMGAGLRRISDDLAASYVLGYYTTNTKWDGRVRRIKVRLKASGAAVRARSEYRGPTAEEIAKASAASPLSTDPVAGRSPVDAALAKLARLRAAATLHVLGAAGPDEVTIVAELAPAGLARWKHGGDLQILVTDASGETVGSARGRLEPGARAALVRVPVTVRKETTARTGSAGSWQALVRLRAEGIASDEQSVTIARPTATLVGDPILFRALAGPNPSLRPVASLEFLRSERLRVEWPALGSLDRRDARLLGRDGEPFPIVVAVSESESGGARIIAADLTLSPLAAGDYLIELTATAGDMSERKLVAFRVMR